MDCLINDVLPAMPMSSIAQAFPKLDSPEEWNCVDLSLVGEGVSISGSMGVKNQ